LRSQAWATPENEVALLRTFEATWLMHNLCIGGRFYLIDQVYAKLCHLNVGSSSNPEAEPINDFDTLKDEMMKVYDDLLFNAPLGNQPPYTSEQFKEGFSQLKVSETKAANVILRQLSNHFEGPERELRNRGTVQVEHILPKKPHPESWWFEEDRFSINEDENTYYKNFISRISNLTLLHAPLNGGAQNSPFPTKHDRYYHESHLTMTSSLSEKYNGEWNTEIIAQRGNDLAEIAIQLWPLIDEIEEYRNPAIVEEV
jgi:hypothetical protein